MKRILLLCVVILGVQNTFSQMYVSPNSYVFVNDQFVYVKEDVNLDNNGHVFLRNQSQLLQGRTGAGINQGLGNLSVFQEGTTNNFQYNFWCSPVGVPSAAAGNSNFGITRLFQPSGLTSSTAALLTSGFDGVAGPSLTISNRWIYTYTASNLYAQWNYIGAASSIAPGYGFTMKGTSGTDAFVAVAADGVQNNAGSAQRYDFRGKPNDGDISTFVSNAAGPSYDNTTLVGNPYPSSLNINLFLLENSGYTVNYGTGAYSYAGGEIIDGAALFWEHNKLNNSHNVGQYVGGYGVYVANGATAFSPGTYTAAPWHTYSNDGESFTAGGSGGNHYERMFKPVGQGFKVRGEVASGNVVMKNLYRAFVKEGAVNASQFERNANTANENGNWDEIPNVAGVDYTQFSRLPAPQFKLLTRINNLQMYETAVAFNNNATDGFDFALDAKSTFGEEAKTVYFKTASNDRKLVITTMPFDITKRIPIAFKTDVPATFDLKVGDIINFNLADNIFLFDGETGMYYDIKNNIHTMVLSAGDTGSRFEITFLDETLSNPTDVSTDFNVVQNNTQGQLTIFNTKNYDIKSITLYDVTGKLIINKANVGSNDSYSYPTSQYSEGVYIVKLTTVDNGEISKKIIISKK
ncbi:T9SS sorting signal type C domain-containing protein [Flavobacterium sp. LMO8]|uniref:T9SS sorting signal type C domain-containing protein n=1 Tax=Flavobacterium sp. LMO8 TaxID=2654244 RepID=UPI0012915A20|nr:T9SS sorting signal type C domain-containing protein [Flavobacterium sp. LMO8]MQP25541.1 T9SS sorting signal type C domain-containing protein [Flavobacterium sp. LMO8]